MAEKPSVVTLSLPASALEKMRSFYAESLEEGNDIIAFRARGEKVVITAYNKEKEGTHKVVFQGENALYESSIWGKSPAKAEEKKPAERVIKRPTPFMTWRDQLGSDEVGTGDFFGPVIVACAFVSFEQRPLLMQLGVADSKTLTDEKILSIGPTLIKELDYSQLCLPNEKYNELIKKGENMNSIKAKMHNRCLLNVASRHPRAIVYQDQFAAPELYYSYLKHEPEVQENILFATKAESKFLCVAAASVIARYSFLVHLQKVGERFDTSFPLGAGAAVDEYAKAFVEKHGKDALREVAKTNFANMKRL